MANEEQIGFHKGSPPPPPPPPQELLRIVQICEQLMQAHIKGLKDLGVDLEAEAKKTTGSLEEQVKK